MFTPRRHELAVGSILRIAATTASALALVLIAGGCAPPTISASPSGSEAQRLSILTATSARPLQPTCSSQGALNVGIYLAMNPDGSMELAGRYLDEPGEPAMQLIEWPLGFTVEPGPPVRVRSNTGIVVAEDGGTVVFEGSSVSGGRFSPCIINGDYYPGG